MQIKDKSYVLNLVNEFFQKIKEEYSIEAIYLYGSFSYGVPNGNSDIDLAIILNEPVDDKKDFDIYVKAQRFNLDLEPVSFSKSEFEQDMTDLIVEIKTRGEKVA